MSHIVLTDIEGTIADIAFVKQVLFPYAHRALPDFVAAHAHEPAVAAELKATAELAGEDPDRRDRLVAILQNWIDEDRKATPLKALQGMIWKQGFAEGHFKAHLYPDAFEWLKRQHRETTPLFVYSSGSIGAQKLYFEHSDHGDIRSWFSGFFDTTSGPKKEAESYRTISRLITQSGQASEGMAGGPQAARIVFFSDSPEELDAAAEAGMIAIQICREGIQPCGRHPHFFTFRSIQLEQL